MKVISSFKPENLKFLFVTCLRVLVLSTCTLFSFGLNSFICISYKTGKVTILFF